MPSELIKITESTLPNIRIDLRYGSNNNFTGKALYKNAHCYLHIEAFEALKRASAIAAALHYSFVIFDAFRPLEIQRKLWEHTPDPSFLSNPDTGSCPHCRGVAVDLNLVDSHGKELDMGTAFDEFSEQSHHGRIDISQEALKNRLILMGIMTSSGWDFYRNEWWHYQLFNARKYTLYSDVDAGTGML